MASMMMMMMIFFLKKKKKKKFKKMPISISLAWTGKRIDGWPPKIRSVITWQVSTKSHCSHFLFLFLFLFFRSYFRLLIPLSRFAELSKWTIFETILRQVHCIVTKIGLVYVEREVLFWLDITHSSISRFYYSIIQKKRLNKMGGEQLVLKTKKAHSLAGSKKSWVLISFLFLLFVIKF